MPLEFCIDHYFQYEHFCFAVGFSPTQRAGCGHNEVYHQVTVWFSASQHWLPSDQHIEPVCLVEHGTVRVRSYLTAVGHYTNVSTAMQLNMKSSVIVRNILFLRCAR